MDNFEPRSVRMQVLITPSADAKMKAVSENKHISKNEIINKALNAYLARFNNVPN